MKVMDWTWTRRAQFAVAIGLFFAVAEESTGQWQFVNLHPQGAQRSAVFAVGDSQQAGYAVVGDIQRAALWQGSASSWVDLNPAGAESSVVMAVGNGQQVGWATFQGAPRAGYWTGTAASWVDLNTASTWSRGYARTAGGQAGHYLVGGTDHAAVWSAGGLTDLNPSGSGRSTILGAGGGQLVGFVEFGSGFNTVRHGAIWNGMAGSFVSLYRPLFQGSDVYATDGYQQGGTSWINDIYHASVWYGTAESWVDLSAGRDSKVFALHDGEQVGFLWSHAAFWRGTASSWVDLHGFAPPGPSYYTSVARGIWHGPHSTIVGGMWANQAGLWVRQDCIADCDRDGMQTLADFGCFQTRFALGSARADCDENGVLNLSDFGCFQTHFAKGCP